ncbi:hypothetical protein M408DRAFT_7829 [Serendipita vermifera MAFF 305830]|uniref:Uncharacterized protein n=1 Tax=Serendipita vermifera MAFF 305830 TaxID=933852 RepID=A0A0C3BCN8_SERVB|nr:hypothetical protein M408DRAFT_7829 [Serendipita vermifera MAFF 305830]
MALLDFDEAHPESIGGLKIGAWNWNFLEDGYDERSNAAFFTGFDIDNCLRLVSLLAGKWFGSDFGFDPIDSRNSVKDALRNEGWKMAGYLTQLDKSGRICHQCRNVSR